MGIKGRRKKLREREERDRAEREQDTENEYADEEGEGIDAGPMGGGTFQLPVDANGNLKIKKSELYKMQDLDYLDRIRDEHQRRRGSHLRGVVTAGGVTAAAEAASGEGTSRKRRRADDDDDTEDRVRAIEEEYLGHHYSQSELTTLAGHGSVPASSSSHHGRHQQQLHSRQWQDRDARGKDIGDMVERETALIEHRKNAATGALFSHPLIDLDADVVRALHTEGFQRMTPIQERTVPYALEGYDILGQARTGSGKTLAFVLPILHSTKAYVQSHPRKMVALVLAPTKELCVQIFDVFKSVCRHLEAARFTVQLITGGTKVLEERKQLIAGPSVVVGTPGRVHDHATHCKGWEMSRLRFLVLDEADRMLADGFKRDLDAILPQLPRSRQTFLFSATNSKSVHELARLSLSKTPIFIATTGTAPTPVAMDDPNDVAAGAFGFGSGFGLPVQNLPPYRAYPDLDEADEEDGSDSDEAHQHNDSDAEEEEAEQQEEDEESEDDAAAGEAIPDTLRQFCLIVAPQDRLRSLYVFIKNVARTSKAMVFCSTVASTTFHFQMMGSVGFHDDVMMLHGHMKHRQRVQAFRAFTEWQTGVLFCTDVAARGLDIPNVEWILQYDPPLDPTEYIHRIGRTARAGNVGNSLLFLMPEEVQFVKYLAKFGIRLEKYPMPKKLPPIQEKLEHVLQLDPIVAKSAVSAFRAHVGAYQSHILKETFNVGQLDLDRLSKGFALTACPHVTLPKNAAETKKQDYVKGKFKSLMRRQKDAHRHYEQFKTKQQWQDGHFVGVYRPNAL